MENKIKRTAITCFIAGVLATTSCLFVKDKIMDFVHQRNPALSSSLNKQEFNEKRKELESILGEYYNKNFSKKYDEFLEYENSIEFARILEERRFSNYEIDDYIVLLKNEKSIKLIKEFDGRFRGYLSEEYLSLLDNGLSPEIIGKMDRFDVKKMSRQLKEDPIPEGLSKYFSLNEYDNSIKAAAHNPIFGTDINKVQNYLQKKLSKKKHIYRKEADYSEDSSQIKDIENINTLYLIKGYMDYFQDSNNIKDITRIIQEDLDDCFSEHGGVVIFDKDKYNFKDINPVKRDIKNLEHNESYRAPFWNHNLRCIGGFHIHAITEDNLEYSGPSGNGGILFGGDLACLDGQTKRNPYRMNCVITKLKEDKFNVDIYFRDVFSSCILGIDDVRSKDKNIVLDLGVYDMIRD